MTGSRARPTQRKTHSSFSLAMFALGIVMILTPILVALNGYGGWILVADSPHLIPPFNRSLILITRHNIEGAEGVILNKPLSPEQASELPRFLRDAGIPVAFGGPIDFPGSLTVVEEKPAAHRIRITAADWDDAVRRVPGLLEKIRAGDKSGIRHYRVFAGLTSWAPFQLETEVGVEHDWFAVRPDMNLVFGNGGETSWENLYRSEQSRKQSGAENRT